MIEIELKYKIASREQMDMIWSDDLFESIEEKDSRGRLSIKAAYFDTEDMLLAQNRVAFRIRKEGDRVVGTLKCKDRAIDQEGLYMREEINVPVANDACFLAPDLTIFKQSEEGREVLELVGAQRLENKFETVFTRRKFRIDTGDSIMEISLDDGEIIADDAHAPISELEIELYSGTKEDLFDIGERVVRKFGLEPEARSKYARGLALLER
ncbi:MAG: CYTH domain-containing protein [Clostridiales Family XIII bacterium]|jgi:inorganic triphosphatase YgiF|nr:CYTH domain-containing protein [Clostridiales Family XIII bacterium]